MPETKRTLPWGLTTRWLMVAGVVLVLAAVTTTFALRVLDPEPPVPTPTIEPSDVDVQPLPTDQGTIALPTEFGTQIELPTEINTIFELPTELSTQIELPTELFTVIQLPTDGAAPGGASETGLPR